MASLRSILHRRPGADTALASLVVLVAFLLRVSPIRYGLPFSYHPDETFLIFDFGRFVEGLLAGNLATGTSAFNYPLGLLYGGYFLIGRLTGRFASLAAFKQAFLLDDPTIHLLGRTLPVLFASGAVFLTYVLGKRLYGSRAGLIASLFMAFSVIDIANTHWVKFDSAVTFMSLASILAMTSVTENGGWRASLRAGLILGLTLAIRVDTFVLLPLLPLAHLLGTRGALFPRLRDTRLFGAVGIALATYFVVSFRAAEILFRNVLGRPRPFPSREIWPSLVDYFLVNDIAASASHNGAFYAGVALATLGVALTVFVAAGLISSLRSRSSGEYLIWAYLLLCGLPLLLFNVFGTHYALRVIPFLMILGARALVSVADWTTKRVPQVPWLAVMLVVAIAQPAYLSARHLLYLRNHVDTRTLARDWIYSHVPFGTPIAVQKVLDLPTNVPLLHETEGHIQRKLVIVRADRRSSGLVFEAMLRDYPRDTYQVINLSFEKHWGDEGRDLENQYDYDGLVSAGVRYIITSGRSNPSTINEDGSPYGVVVPDRIVNQDEVKRYAQFMRALQQRGRLLAEFAPADPRVVRLIDAPIDPTIRVYSLTRE